MIDTHFHILPGIDDGPAGLGEAVAMGRAAAEAGTRVIAATSHVDHGFSVDPAALPALRAQVAAALADAGVDVQLVQGGEIALSRLVDLDDGQLRSLTLGDGPYLLLESPFSVDVADMEPLVRGLRAKGFEVMLAHPERCPAFQRDHGRVPRLVEAGALVQLTTGSLRGDFGSTVRDFALDLLADGHVHCLATDAHDLERRPPGLAGALDRTRFGALAPWLCEAVPAAILRGAALPPRPAVAVPGHRGLGRLFRRA